MLQEILVVLVSVAIATRIALDWLRDVKKAADATPSTTNGPRAKDV